MRRKLSWILLFVIPVAFGSGAAIAADDEKPGWYLDADLASVMTSGNSESNTIGFGAKVRRLWTRSRLVIQGGATETQSALITRTARGTVTDFVVHEEKVTSKTSELYFARGWYRFDLSPKFFLFSGADWMSNRFAGIDSRFLIALGAGNIWTETEAVKFNTFYSMTYTFQEDVVDNPFVKADFPGVRLGYGLEAKLSSSTTIESTLIADMSLENTDDVRLDWYNALPVSISETLQLKPALRLFWRNQPALTDIPLFDGGGVPTGDAVAVPLKELDTVFSLALVVKLGPKAE